MRRPSPAPCDFTLFAGATHEHDYAYAATDATAPLAPIEIQRRELRAHDVQIEMLFCGVCHSDLHQARNEWKNTVFPSCRATRSSAA